MTLSDSLRAVGRAIRDYRSSRKITLDSYIDPTLTWLALNGAAIYGGDQLLDLVSKNTCENQGPAMLGTYLGLTAGLIAANKYIFTPISGAIRRFHQRRRARGNQATALSWARTATQLGALTFLASTPQAQRTIDDYTWDARRVVGAFSRTSPEREEQSIYFPAPEVEPKSLEDLIPDSLKKIRISDYNPSSDLGRFYRTYRWKSIIENVEKKYGLEKGILAGLIMRESGGNPLMLNAGDDGGAGGFQFQPGTAKAYDLKTFDGSESIGRDRNHGEKLRRLAEENSYDYETLAQLDERFDIIKSADAAGRYLKALEDKHGSIVKAVSAYNRGTPAKDPESTAHVKGVLKYQKFYLEQAENM